MKTKLISDLARLFCAVAVGAVCAASVCRAQTFTVLKSFGTLTNITGWHPEAQLVQGPDGALYGTASDSEGGAAGTVFRIQPDGTGFTVLKWFTNSLEGQRPAGVLVLADGELYGTTSAGGSFGGGTVFKLNTDGTGYAVLYSFSGSPDGADPSAGLILSGSTLYGTTSGGGSSYSGTVFKLNTNGTGYAVLYSFTDSPDGANPSGELVLGGRTLFGTTYNGGSSGNGTMFKLDTNGLGYEALYSFGALSGAADGAQPNGGLALSGGGLYGTVSAGGMYGYGGVFEFDTNGCCTPAMIHDFSGSFYGDGATPFGSLVLSGATLYGTTHDGGSADSGTVFKLNTDGNNYGVLYSFTNSPDGANPYAGLVFSSGTLYGTTYGGGSSGDYGTVFKVDIGGLGYTTLYSFSHSQDESGPVAGLVLAGGRLYGTTSQSGGAEGGNVFSLSTNGTGYIVFHSFTNYPAFPDGVNPTGDLVLSGSNLLATTYGGGSSASGTIFQVNTNGSGYGVLTSFGGLSFGAYPEAGLVLSGSILFGTTHDGGRFGYGTLFQVNTDGSGFAVLKDFAGSPDGAGPEAGLVLSGSTLYGTTYSGGSFNHGTIFTLNTNGIGYRVLTNFTMPNGVNPAAGLVLSGSTLYGTTRYGGGAGYGTVFQVNTNGSGYTVLYDFTGSPDGANPLAGLVLRGSTLYGTTQAGGSSSYGTVFQMHTDGTGYRVLKRFTGLPDGAYPKADLLLSGSALYGTTFTGGDLDKGTVFKLDLTLSPIPLLFQHLPGKLVLNWTNAAFSLQSAPEATGVYTNIAGASSPFTNAISGNRHFFRLNYPY